MASEVFDSEARLSWVLAGLAGVLGATAFTHSAAGAAPPPPATSSRS